MSRELAGTVAIAVILRGDELLVYAVPHPDGGVAWMPPRGTIEIGRQGGDVAVRAIREQLGVEVIEPSCIGILEHDYPYPGVVAHEQQRRTPCASLIRDSTGASSSIVSKRRVCG